MKVYTATGIGIALGFLIGAIALGIIDLGKQDQLTAQTWVWWIVVITTILPFVSYLKNELLLKGDVGGFVTGLGTGLGFFLLLVGRVGI